MRGSRGQRAVEIGVRSCVMRPSFHRATLARWPHARAGARSMPALQPPCARVRCLTAAYLVGCLASESARACASAWYVHLKVLEPKVTRWSILSA
jgi:hypothetical protein